MGLMDIAQEEVPELEAAPEGEYRVEISRVDFKEDKNGRPGYTVYLRVDRPNSKRVIKRIGLPVDTDDEDAANSYKRSAKAFITAFDLKSDNPDDMIGKEAWALLGVDVDDEYGESNYVKRFIVQK